MYRLFTALIITIVLIGSCKNKNNVKPIISATTDTSIAFPIIELLQNDAADVLKTPYFIYKITSTGKDKQIRDSSLIQQIEFAKIIDPILQIHIDKNKFKEDVFHDLTTKSNTFINTAIDENIDVKSITALFNDETNKLKTAFIVIEKNFGDSSVRKNYYWKVNKSLSVATTTNYKNGQTKEETLFINWNDRAE